MKHAQASDPFTLRSLARVALRCGVPNEQSMMVASIFVDHHRGMIEELGDGNMVIRDEDKTKREPIGHQGYSDMFKGFANAAASGKVNLDDE
jgi:hypothetical protein